MESTLPTHTNKIYRICITGGPCAGKTTCMSVLREKLSPQFQVYALPEVASFTFGGGVTIIPTEFTPEDHVVFTGGIMEMQYNLENYFSKIASIQTQDVVILTDRGIMDNTAYCSPETEQKVYEQYGWNKSSIRDNRYDMVVHLVTAANGAEEFYTLANNEARSETPEVARGLDVKTQSVWNGHPNHVIINNNASSFDEKIERAYEAICRTLGVQSVPNYNRKFLLTEDIPLASVPAEMGAEQFTETITFLNSNEDDHITWIKSRVSQAGKGAPYLGYVDRKLSTKRSERIEIRRRVAPDMFGEYMKVKDPARKEIVKTIIAFIYHGNNFSIECFDDHTGNKLRIVRVNVDSDSTEIQFPEFLKKGTEVSEDPKYFSHNIADPLFA